MSLLQQIITSDSRAGTWESTTTRFIQAINFHDRESAEKAFDDVEPFYNQIWANGTWDGIKETTGLIPEYAKTSQHSKLWLDENQKGFSLCVSFSNLLQRNEIREKFRPFFRDNEIKQLNATLNESERMRIDRLEESTHSVEMDVSNSVLTPNVITDFMNVAITMPTNQPTLYVDDILKDGKRRLKAYYKTHDAAEKFAEVCDLKVRQPLAKLTSKPDQEALDMIALPLVRKFKQPKLLVAA